MSGGRRVVGTALAFLVLTLAAIPAETAAAAAPPKHSPRFLNARRLNAGLAGTPLAGYGFDFEAAGWRYNVNPFFVAAIAGTESSFGAAACGGNAWGIASCGMTFPTFHEGLWYTTKLLREHYLGKGLLTLVAVGTKYAACGTCWAASTERHMRRFSAAPPLTYPR